jgi:two-component system sensor histidine kinase MtrB
VDRPAIRPGSLRRRLTIAFLLVAGLSAAALAVASYAIVREARLSDSVDRSLEQSRFNLILANETLSREPNVPEINQLLAAYERRGGFETVGTTGDRRFSSSVSVGMQEVPPPLRALVSTGRLGYERLDVAGTRYLIVGGQVKNADTELYYFYSEERLWDELAQLRNVLLAALGVVALLGALVGAVLARRILAPVGRASQAAHSLAEGLLETRLPVESGDEFGVWALSFNEMAEALEAKIRALSESQARERRFTSDVSHELRTPLTALVAEASLLAEQLDKMPPDARRPAELLVDDVARLRDLVEDLMEISRLDAGEARVREERIDLGSLVRAAVRSRGWDDRVSVDGGDVVLQSDHRRLERIASNLIGNALEHGGREVTARVGRDGIGSFLEVSDRGAGIPPDRLPHVFDRFYKADTARAGPGSGLGLAIALENARLLGGDIEVWSEVGTGTRFTLRLPA